VLFDVVNLVNAHSVQVAYCVDCNGNLRIFVEHWHGSASVNSTNMTINLTINGVTTSQTQSPAFGILNVPFGQLPGCVTPVTYVTGCPGQQNTYNDWVVYDYFNLPAGVPLAFTIVSGNNVFTQDGCGMFPLTVNFTIPPSVINGAPLNVCNGQQTTLIPVPNGVSWTNTNPNIGLPSSGTGPIQPFTAVGPATAVITYSNACGINNTTLNIVPSLNSSYTNNTPSNAVCLGTAISFSNTSPVSSGWQWNFGNGNTSTQQNPTYVYPSPGTYTASLTVTNGNSCPGTSVQTITVHPFPTPNFTLIPNCQNTPTVNVVNSTTLAGIQMSYTWTAGSASPNTSTLTNPSFTFPNATGVYTVNLFALANIGCSGTLTKTVSIFPKPLISFTANPVCKGFFTNFTNNSSVAPPSSLTNWFWDFNNDNIPDNTNFTASNIFPNDGVYPVELVGITNNGCKDSALVNITVHATPTVAFSAANNCANTAISIVNTSSINAPSIINQYNWSFGAGAAPPNSTLVNPNNLNYTTPGIKTITLSLVSNNSCSATATQTLLIYTAPTASFNANNVCSGLAVTFTDATTPVGAVTNWEWDFDNNFTIESTLQNPSNTYLAPGIYSVNLIATANTGCKDTIQKVISIYGRAIPNFNVSEVCFNQASSFFGYANTTLNFNTGNIAAWNWNFGDAGSGGTSNLQNPTYTYTNSNNSTLNTSYQATLSVTTSDGCIDAVVKPVVVYSMPTPDFTADSACFGYNSTLTNNSNGNGNPFSLFSWDFNNDNIPEISNNTNFCVNTFTNWGNNAVTFTVYTAPNSTLTCSSQITKNIWVHPTPTALFNHTNKCVNEQPNLMDGSSSNVQSGSIINYAWDYGNGNTNLINTGPLTSYSYAAAGNYIVTLTVTSAAGCYDTARKVVEVWEKPYATFNYSKVCAGKKTILKATQLPYSSIITQYDWDLNNNPTNFEAFGNTVNFLTSAGGIQPVNLYLTSEKGCLNNVTQNIYVNYSPAPTFTTTKKEGCPTLCVNFTDNTAAITGPAKNIKWDWDYGNNNTDVSYQPNVTFQSCFTNTSNIKIAYYKIKLTITTDSGCVDSVVKSNFIKVFPKPYASFNWYGEEGNLFSPIIAFENTSIGQISSHWYFNDGDNFTDSITKNPKHYYNTDIPRSYNVFLAVRNEFGCKDTTTRLVEIMPELTFYIPNAFTPNDDGKNDIFYGKGIGIKTFKMWIFDRWGEAIFYSDDITKGWDGSVKSKSVEDKIDVYAYKVILTDYNNKLHEYVGHVTISK